ncbi:MAG: hypothetical protein RI907_476 [Pseudomonadota bacterium]|jgi:DNA-binding transcriptional regulator YbjK
MSAAERKTTIADAALSLLATTGARGLTHRAVDALAGLPAGSTSSSCRTRLDLLTLALQRHAQLHLDELQADAVELAHAPPSLPRFIEALTDRVMAWLTPEHRPRNVAQFELFLIASREPSLQHVVLTLHQRFVQATAAALTQAGVADVDTVARGLIATVDGLLIAQAAQTSPPPERQACRAILMRAVAAG